MGGNMAVDARKASRYPVTKNIHFSVSVLDFRETKWVDAVATTLNISKSGACIKTAFSLEPGHVLSISRDPDMRVAIVKWVKQEDASYIAGIMLMS